MEKQTAEIAIAALLHDIGKVSQRAKIPLTEQSERMKSSACPINNGNHTHLHVPLTNQFFEQVQGWIPRELDHTVIANLATYHHRPGHESDAEFIVQQADWYSSGQDRGAIVENADYIRGRMNSIFEQLKLDGKESKTAEAYIPIQSQSLDEQSFPNSSLTKDSIAQENKKLYNQLVSHIQKIKDVPPNILCEQLEWIYSQYCWCVPSSLSYGEYPDVSLLDHSTTTAGFAACLHQYHSHNGSLNQQSICDQKTKKFRIVSGDFSGIQDYIFNGIQTQQKGTSKRLRARSFYIGVLGRIASSLILDELGLPCFCRFMEAGGRFILLVPNTSETVDKLSEISVKMDQWLLKTFNGLLRLNLSFDLELSGSDFMQDNYKAMVQAPIAKEVDLAKRRQFSNVLVENGKWSPDEFVISNNPKEFDEKEEKYFNKLGEILPKAKYLVVGECDKSLPGMVSSKIEFSKIFGMRAINFVEDLPDNEKRTIKSYYQFAPTKEASSADILSGVYMANYVPKIKAIDQTMYKHFNMERLAEESGEQIQISASESIKTFAHLAADSCWIDKVNGKEVVKGAGLLGVLKADVDRLGLIFSEGLGDNISVSRVASLSRQVDLFFKGILTNQFQVNPKFKDIYTVYAGGDDLLFVGPWRVMFEFAKYLRDLFAQYTCQNEAITISASIILCKSSYPLAQAACEAEEGLERAKEAGRNRITVFGETLEWDGYVEALKNMQIIDDAVNGRSESFKMSSSFAYKLVKYARMAKNAASDKPKLENLKWRSQLSYDIARNVKPSLKDNDVPAQDAFSKFNKITAIDKEKIAAKASKLLVAASYSTYKNRSV